MKNKEMLWKNQGIKIHENIKVLGQLYVSDYSQLRNAEGQRGLVAKGYKQLTDSMSNYGICSCPIVVRQKKMYTVVDGWHRISAAKKNELDIICSIVEPSCSINELMIILNTTQINWNIEAYLNNGIVYHKNKNYVELREIWEDTGLNLGALYELYSHDLTAPQSKKSFEAGTWQITTKPLGNKVIKYIEIINPYISFSYKTNFVRAFVKTVKNKQFDINHLIKQLKKFPHHIHDSGDRISGHKKMINKIYNHCCIEEEQVYLG